MNNKKDPLNRLVKYKIFDDHYQGIALQKVNSHTDKDIKMYKILHEHGYIRWIFLHEIYHIGELTDEAHEIINNLDDY